MNDARRALARWLWLVALTALFLTGCRCGGSAEVSGGGGDAEAKARPDEVGLLFAFGSEKKEWLDDAISRFNASPEAVVGGKRIRVTGKAMGSGATVDDVLAGTLQPAVWSPAGSLYRDLLERGWAKKQGAVGTTKPITNEGKPLVLSPLVVAMWKPMAQALGWPQTPIGWSDILALSTSPDGWATKGHPEWGAFRLGHTHPRQSNSGTLAVLAELYAGLGTTRGLTAQSVEDPRAAPFVEAIEQSIVHYGKSTGFFADKMLTRGPSYLSAAVLYENLVVDSYRQAQYQSREMDVVCIYPKEGTFWIDNPYLVLDAPWVSPEQRAAAEVFEKFLRSSDEQRRAMTEFGFRPTDPTIAIGAPLDAAHGVDPKQPQTLLESPPVEVVEAALALWQRVKKTVDIVFVFDRSGSMRGEPLRQAKEGAKEFLRELDDRDRVSLLFFNHEVPANLPPPTELGPNRQALQAQIEGTFAEGGTALYDAVALAQAQLTRLAAADPKRMYAVVALTDGRDENSGTAQGTLERAIRIDPESAGAPVRVFTIAYGSGADGTLLGSLAEVGGGATFQGDTSSIRQVYRDLAAFF